MPTLTNPYRRGIRALAVTLVVYTLLVATHLGEFWPFSIYPMFSTAGQPWTRAIVRDVEADAVDWAAVTMGDLPGEAFPLDEHGLFQNDLANYVKKVQAWDESRVAGLRRMFRNVEGRRLLLMRVQGRLTEASDVEVRAEPIAFLSPDTTLLNPSLAR